MTLIYMREVKRHFEATLFSLKIFSEGGEKTNITSAAHKHEQSICLFICLTVLLKNRPVKLLTCWYNFACNMKWLSIPILETNRQIFIAAFALEKFACVKKRHNKIATLVECEERTAEIIDGRNPLNSISCDKNSFKFCSQGTSQMQ